MKNEKSLRILVFILLCIIVAGGVYIILSKKSSKNTADSGKEKNLTTTISQLKSTNIKLEKRTKKFENINSLKPFMQDFLKIYYHSNDSYTYKKRQEDLKKYYTEKGFKKEMPDQKSIDTPTADTNVKQKADNIEIYLTDIQDETIVMALVTTTISAPKALDNTNTYLLKFKVIYTDDGWKIEETTESKKFILFDDLGEY